MATLVGQVILLLILVLIGLSAVSGLKKKEKKSIADGSVLHLKLNSVITDQAPSEDLAFFNQLSGDISAPMGLISLVERIKVAAKDSKIKGIFLDLSFFEAGYAKADELHDAMTEFRKSGKFIYAYSDFYYNNTYYLASAADKVFMNPQGEMLFNGLVSDVTFFKGALEKLGVEVQVVRRGKFKGAVEPFTRDNLSEENRAQIQSYISSVYDALTMDIAKSRKMTAERVKEIAGDMLVRSPEDAVKFGLVDELNYRDQVYEIIRKKLKLKDGDKIPFVQPGEIELPETSEKSEIALVYASGDIVNGEGQNGEVGADKFAGLLRKLRKDKKVKAVVLRVDSRGGSALASDIIWRETILLKAVKPLIVTMSDVAASGGYYIACAADTIVAYPQTITGSIGVFGLVPNAQKLLNDKLGINSEYVGTGNYSDFGRIDRAMTPQEYAIIDGMVGRVYETFKKRVGDGRGMSVEMVDSFGQGRVWTGTMAKERGLVDVMGGYQKAIDIAAFKAGLKEYSISEYPKNRSVFEELMGKFNQEETARNMLKKELGSTYSTYLSIRRLNELSGVVAWFPYEILFK